MTDTDLARQTAHPSSVTSAGAPRRPGVWIDHWRPDDEVFWSTGGEKIARKNLWLSMFAEHIGFSVWVIWTIVVLNLANIGIKLSVSELFLLTLVPNLIGSMLRVPYTFAVPRFGGRAWTTVSATLLFLPTLLLAFLVPSGWLLHQAHDTQLWVLFLCAATAGVGGGNFSSSMANISFFYPERKKGWALGLNAAGGNLGVASAQLLVPLVIIIGIPAAAVKLTKHHVHMSYAGLMWLPLIALAVFGVAVHEQPDGGQGGHPVLRGVAPLRPHVDHVVPVHRHVRLVHRVLVRPAARHQEHVPRVPRPPSLHRHLPGRPGVHRCARRIARPADRRVAVGQGRRGPRHPRNVRRHGDLHHCRHRRRPDPELRPCSSAPTW